MGKKHGKIRLPKDVYKRQGIEDGDDNGTLRAHQYADISK